MMSDMYKGCSIHKLWYFVLAVYFCGLYRIILSYTNRLVLGTETDYVLFQVRAKFEYKV